MDGYWLIVVGLMAIAVGSGLTIWGQSIKSKEETDQLVKQNEGQSQQIEHLREEAEILRNIGKSQLMATFYTQELNHEIRTIYFRLRLRKPMLFQELCPLKFAFEFNPGGDASFRFRKLITDGGIKSVSSGQEVLVESYKINSLSFDERVKINDSYVFSLSAGPAVSEILIPAVLAGEVKGIVKNFHDQNFFVYMSDKLIGEIASIELIVNGWGILSIDPTTAYWKESGGSDWTSLASPELKLKRPFTNDGRDVAQLPLPLWTINVYQGIPSKYERLSSKDWK